MTSTPEIHILYRDGDYHGPYPDAFACAQQVQISSQGTGTLCRLGHGRVAKFGSHVRAAEAFNMTYARAFASTMIPKVYACYQIGPYDRDPADYGSVYDTFIIMDLVRGQTLEKSWESLDHMAKISIASQLRAHLEDLRSIPPPSEGYVGSIMDGPVLDSLFDTAQCKGPFKNEEEFNAALVAMHAKAVPKAHMDQLIAGALSQFQHKSVFSHADLRGDNIMVLGNDISGIVDWEMSGFYPCYWEFVKAFSVGAWAPDWPEFVSLAAGSYFAEWAIYDLVRRHIW